MIYNQVDCESNCQRVDDLTRDLEYAKKRLADVRAITEGDAYRMAGDFVQCDASPHKKQACADRLVGLILLLTDGKK